MDHITKIFETRMEAERALSQLEAIGVREDQVSLIATDEARSRHFSIENSTKAEEGAATGATIGGLTAAVVAALTSAGAVAIPGLNLVVAGYLVSAVTGLGVGAAAGGLLGALVGLGIPENEAKLYEDELGRGNILLAVKPRNDDQKDRIKEILKEAEDDSGSSIAGVRARRDDANLRM